MSYSNPSSSGGEGITDAAPLDANDDAILQPLREVAPSKSTARTHFLVEDERMELSESILERPLLAGAHRRIASGRRSNFHPASWIQTSEARFAYEENAQLLCVMLVHIANVYPSTASMEQLHLCRCRSIRSKAIHRASAFVHAPSKSASWPPIAIEDEERLIVEAEVRYGPIVSGETRSLAS
jgi:hypothetical protein